MRVVHVGFHLDRHHREPAALLDAGPVLTALATAVRSAGPEVVVVQPARTEATLRRAGVVYRFVVERPALFRRGTPGTRPVRTPAAATVGAVAEADPDVVHVNGLSVPRFARRIRDRLPSAAIVAQNHLDRPPSPWRRPGARRAARAYDAVAFTAREQAARSSKRVCSHRDCPSTRCRRCRLTSGPVPSRPPAAASAFTATRRWRGSVV